MAMGCSKIKNDSDNFYNVVKRENSEKYDFNWNEFSKGLGYEEPPSFFVCDSLNYLNCICTTLKKNWKTPKWRSFWIYLFLRQMIMFNQNLRHIYYKAVPYILSLPYFFQGYNPFRFIKFNPLVTLLFFFGAIFFLLSLIYYKYASRESDLERKNIRTGGII